MNVQELKALVPLVEISELQPDVKYLVRFPRNTEHIVLDHAAHLLRDSGIKAVILVGDEIKFYEIS